MPYCRIDGHDAEEVGVKIVEDHELLYMYTVAYQSSKALTPEFKRARTTVADIDVAYHYACT